METILVYNECVRLIKEPSRSSVVHFIVQEDVEKTGVITACRYSSYLTIPVTAKLNEYLKLYKTPAKLDVGHAIFGPVIAFGFCIRNLYERCCFPKAYIEVWNLQDFRDTVVGVEFLNDNAVMLKLEIESLENKATNMALKPDVTTHMFTLTDSSSEIGFASGVVITIEPEAEITKLEADWNDENANWELTFSLSLVIHPKNGADVRVTDQVAFVRNMLRDEDLCDVTIVPGCGTPIKCHKSVLASHSPVFKAMFGRNMKEARTGMVEVVGMTEEGVRAMLDYLYGWRTIAAQENPIVCVELLEASDKYDLPELDRAMEQLLMKKEVDWFTPEASLRLLLFLKDKDPSELKTKALKVFRLKFDEIKKLSAYTELFKEGQDVLTAVFNYLAIN